MRYLLGRWLSAQNLFSLLKFLSAAVVTVCCGVMAAEHAISLPEHALSSRSQLCLCCLLACITKHSLIVSSRSLIYLSPAGEVLARD
jgi:hypothetical protein